VETDPASEGAITRIPRPSQSNPSSRRGFKIMRLGELLDQKSGGWLIKGVLREGELTVLFAPPAAGKTFVVLDMGLKVAAGLPWWDHKTNKAPVLYLAGEGSGGLVKRTTAWGLHHGIDTRELDFYVLPQSISLGDEREFATLTADIDSLPSKPGLIFVDTLARYMPGCDENSAQEVGLIISRCATLQATFGATVGLVHHTAKFQPFERGSSALRGAADSMFQIQRTGHEIKIEGSKAKDDALLEPIILQTQSITVGQDDDGDPITSLVLLRGTGQTLVDMGKPVPASAAEDAPTRLEKVGHVIREILAERFGGGPVLGKELAKEVGGVKSTYYDALNAELGAGRIGAEGKRHKSYRLLPAAPEFERSDQDPSPVESESESESGPTPRGETPDSNSDSPSERGVVVAQSESESAAPPRGQGLDSDSRPASGAGEVTRG
jgi:hypothetical protein